jgi:ferrous iron transport protein A
MKLSELKIGQSAKVITILESKFSLRIMELGLVVGSTITFKSKAPLGDPIAYIIGDSTISMRKSEAQQVEVELIA